MKNKLPENNSIRLASLDILRGFDLFLLVFFQPVFVALARQMNMSFLDSILYQFDHEVWEGFRFWDLVMPLFLFMTGASMPFSLSKYMGLREVIGLCIGESWSVFFSCLSSEWLFRETCSVWTPRIFICIPIHCSLLLSVILLLRSFSCTSRSSGR